jgi:hypothetical protein
MVEWVESAGEGGSAVWVLFGAFEMVVSAGEGGSAVWVLLVIEFAVS